MILETATITAGALVVYHHLVFPKLLARLGRDGGNSLENKQQLSPRRRPGPTHFNMSPACEQNPLPKISLIIPAHNEEAVIAAKLRNIAALDYPADKLQLVIICDGCTDHTVDVIRNTMLEPELAHLDLRLIPRSENHGKVDCLNLAARRADGEILAYSDASALLSLDALKRAATWFANPKIGVAAATYKMLIPGSTGQATYWHYQRNVKRAEAAIGAPMGVHGALYFARKSLVRPLPTDTINDDFILPMRIAAEGYRVIYDDQIVGVELENVGDAVDFKRRRRIGAGNLQQLWRMRDLLHPRHGGIAFAFSSGKGLRAVMPYVMLIALAGSLALSPSSPLFAALGALQIIGYLGAAAASLIPADKRPKAASLLQYLVFGHVSALIGATAWLCGAYRKPWRRVAAKTA